MEYGFGQHHARQPPTCRHALHTVFVTWLLPFPSPVLRGYFVSICLQGYKIWTGSETDHHGCYRSRHQDSAKNQGTELNLMLLTRAILGVFSNKRIGAGRLGGQMGDDLGMSGKAGGKLNIHQCQKPHCSRKRPTYMYNICITGMPLNKRPLI